MWRISSADGTRWVQFDDGAVLARPAEVYGLVTDDQPVEIATMSGAFYTPTGPDDEVAVFLRARHAVGARQTITGNPPRVPTAPGTGGSLGVAS